MRSCKRKKKGHGKDSHSGELKDMPVHIRTYKCEKCGLNIDRDQNAAINILSKAKGEGLAFVGAIPSIAMIQEAPSIK